MRPPEHSIIQSYSERAADYDSEGNLQSCWGRLASRVTSQITLKERYELVLDVGCGAGQSLAHLAREGSDRVRFVGVEPAEKMRAHAEENVRDHPNVQILDGRFETIPLETDSVDFLFSILAFHWVTDLDGAVAELARVLKPDGDLDIYFVGRDTGKEFVGKTTPILIKHMGLSWIVNSAKMRKHLDLEGTKGLFSRHFPREKVRVSEERETYHDTLDGHWSWWVSRLSGHFADMAPEKRIQCDEESRAALSTLGKADRIPFSVHLLRVEVRS